MTRKTAVAEPAPPRTRRQRRGTSATFASEGGILASFSKVALTGENSTMACTADRSTEDGARRVE